MVANIRIGLSQRHMTHADLAHQVSPHRSRRAADVHLSRRMTGVIPFSLEDLSVISSILNVPAADLLMDGHKVDPVMVAFSQAIAQLRIEFRKIEAADVR